MSQVQDEVESEQIEFGNHSVSLDLVGFTILFSLALCYPICYNLLAEPLIFSCCFILPPLFLTTAAGFGISVDDVEQDQSQRLQEEAARNLGRSFKPSSRRAKSAQSVKGRFHLILCQLPRDLLTFFLWKIQPQSLFQFSVLLVKVFHFALGETKNQA